MKNLVWAYRTLKKRRVYTFLGISGFAIGFAVFMSIVLFVDHEKSMDAIYANHERIYRVLADTEDGLDAQIDYELNILLEDNFTEVTQACPVKQKANWPFLFRSESGSIKTADFLSTTNSFFSMFSVKVIKSISLHPLADKNSIVLTESTASKLFPNSDPLGKVVKFLGEEKLTVSAVIEDLPSKSTFKADLIISSETPNYRLGSKYIKGNKINPVNHYITLNENVDQDVFTERINRSLSSNDVEVEKVLLQSVGDIYYSGDIKGNTNKSGNKTLLYLFEAIGCLILALSFINYLYFILATQSFSQKSANLKLLHGAGFGHIIRYHLTESGVSLFLAFLLSIVLLVNGLPLMNSILNTSLTFSMLYKGQILIVISTILVFIVLALALLSGLSSRKRGLFSNRDRVNSNSKPTVNSFLSVFQLVVSIVLVIGAIVVKNQLNMMQNSSLGFDSKQVVRLEIPLTFRDFSAFNEHIDKLSFVENSSWSCGSPGSISFEAHLTENDKPVSFRGFSGDENFLATMGISCTEGRNFLLSDKEKACMINQATLKVTGCKTLDEFVEKHNTVLWNVNIVGVVNDFNIASLHDKIEPTFFLFSANDYSYLNVKLGSGSVLDQMKELKEVWYEFIPDHPFDATFYDAYFDSLYRKEERQGKALTFFSIITILITSLGLLGQIIHYTTAKTKEIGIRRVNGAKIGEILTLLNKNFIQWVAIAFVVAIPISCYAMHQWLENFAYKTELSWWIFALAGLLALGIALLTVSWQSWKAATRNPVEALRHE